MKTALTIFAFLFLNTFYSYTTYANNLLIENVTTNGVNSIEFDISWENSWNNGTIHDAVWVFVKYRVPIDVNCVQNFSKFTHAKLRLKQPQFPKSLIANIVDATPNNTGIMIRRRAIGNHPSSPSGRVTLNLIDNLPTNVEIRIYGIEMTFVNQGAFNLGDNGTSVGSFTEGNTNNPFFVSSNNAISIGTNNGQLNAISNIPSTIPNTYPKGFNSFYCMKTEVTQGMYVEFLNTLALLPSSNRCEPIPYDTYTVGGTFNNYTDGGIPDRACSDLSFADLAAFLDWAALRPMTELEFEKACRGTSTPINGEYAWGDANIVAVGSRTNDGTNSESVSNSGTKGVCNFGLGTSFMTIRVGFLGSPINSRTTIGAGFYGNTELSGNLFEHVVNTNPNGISFDGSLGDGVVDGMGNANVPNWQSFLTSNSGTGFRGGAWFAGWWYTRTSDRSYINLGNVSDRYSNAGGRGCR